MLHFRFPLLLILVCTLSLGGCALPASGVIIPNPGPVAPAPADEPVPEPEPEPERARILAVGDLLMHVPLVDASTLPGGDWDFTPLFAPVRPWIEEADLALANLETTLTGPAYPWSGYPSFNTPPEFARDLKAVGFDAVTNANNHALDYDWYGVEQTIEALEAYGLPHTGTARSRDEQEEILVLEVTPDIRLAVLAYTYGTNGVPLPDPWSVNLLDPDRIAADIARARSLDGVDLVAVALHFGEEYVREPSAEQESYVDLALEAGADIVLGSHPHVIQRIELRHVTDQFGRSLPRAVIFSLGNFISCQEGVAKEAGLMLLVDVKKEDGLASVEKVSFIPTWVHRYQGKDGRTQFRVVPVEQAIHAYEAGLDPLLSAADYERLKAVWEDTLAYAIGSPEVAIEPVE